VKQQALEWVTWHDEPKTAQCGLWTRVQCSLCGFLNLRKPPSRFSRTQRFTAVVYCGLHNTQRHTLATGSRQKALRFMLYPAMTDVCSLFRGLPRQMLKKRTSRLSRPIDYASSASKRPQPREIPKPRFSALSPPNPTQPTPTQQQHCYRFRVSARCPLSPLRPVTGRMLSAAEALIRGRYWDVSSAITHRRSNRLTAGAAPPCDGGNGCAWGGGGGGSRRCWLCAAMSCARVAQRQSRTLNGAVPLFKTTAWMFQNYCRRVVSGKALHDLECSRMF